MTTKTIIVPVNSTDAAKTAVVYALGISKKMDVQIVFVQCYGEVDHSAHLNVDMIAASPPASTDILRLQKLNEQRLQEFLGQFHELDKLDHKSILKLGAVTEVICQTAKDEAAALMVMGTEGASKIKGFFAGTTSEKVSRKAPCPVLVVPEGAVPTSIRTIGLALDMPVTVRTHALDLLWDLVQNFRSQLTVIHGSESQDSALRETLLAAYTNSLEKVDPSFHILVDEDAERAIAKLISEKQMDILAIIYGEHGFFERLFRQGTRKNLVFDSDIPVLVLK